VTDPDRLTQFERRSRLARWRSGLGLLAFLMATAPTAHAEPAAAADLTSPLPPEVDDGWLSGFLRAFREPPLWVPGAGNGFRSRMRLSLLAHTGVLISLRIDEREDGRRLGTAVIVTNQGHGRSRDVQRFGVSRRQWEGLQRQLDSVGIWRFEHGIWGQDVACIDGLVMIFERVSGEGYRSSQANAQCTAPPALLQAADRWMEIADVDYFRSWVR
jgi:hypothetical protein